MYSPSLPDEIDLRELYNKYKEVLQKKGTTYQLAQIKNLKELRTPHPDFPNLYDHESHGLPVTL